MLKQPVTYRCMARDANCMAHKMARWAIEVYATVTFWNMQVPKDAPRSQLQDIHKQQGEKLWFDWVGLPKLFDWMLQQPESKPDITVTAMVKQRYTKQVT